MNARSLSSALAGSLLLLAGLVLWGCQRPAVEEAVATNGGVHADHASHASPGLADLEARGGDSWIGPREVRAYRASDLARIRAGTSLYQQFARAVADGFVDPGGAGECVAHPEYGGMGVHLVNFDRYATLEIDPARPEILLYEPQEDGSMKLVGVEFAVGAEAWQAAGNEGPPSVAGVPYDPPNPEAESPIVRTSWTLHVWTWQSNPNGRFFPFNPRVRCLDG
jgi:hypothetical protein